MTPSFVEYGGMTTAPGPFSCTDAVMYAFFLEGDPGRLQALCDKVFAEPTGGAHRYHAIGRHVMLTFGTMNVRSMIPPYDQVGYVVELHAALWILTTAVRESGHHLVADRIAAFVPAIWVDNPISLAGGREIYGFAKNWGWPTLPDTETLDAFTLDTFGGNFGRDNTAGRNRLFALERTDRDRALTLVKLRDMGHAIDVAAELAVPTERGEIVLPSLRLARSLFDEFRGHQMRQVFLKQFRSAQDGTLASQQQIVEALTKIDRIEIHRIDHSYRFTLEHLDSHPLAEQLGLHDQVVGWGLVSSSDFVQEAGAVLWERDDTL